MSGHTILFKTSIFDIVRLFHAWGRSLAKKAKMFEAKKLTEN